MRGAYEAEALVDVDGRVDESESRECKDWEQLDERPLDRIRYSLEGALGGREVKVERESREDGEKLCQRGGPRNFCRQENGDNL